MDSQTPSDEIDIDIADIARGRRITAVTASELKLTPRTTDRPKADSPFRKMGRKMMAKALRNRPVDPAD